MSNDLTMPLKNLLAQAAKNLPAMTGETDPYRRRFAGATATTIILCDVSGSMGEFAGGRLKIDHLQDALNGLLHDGFPRVVIGFNSVAFSLGTLGPECTTFSPGCLAPSGGTAMHLGLEECQKHRPSHTVVISDGLPDSQDSALAAAEKITGTIDVIYCGPDSDAAAIDFMRRLARAGGGRVVVHDLKRTDRPALAQTVRQVLALPAPGGRA